MKLELRTAAKTMEEAAQVVANHIDEQIQVHQCGVGVVFPRGVIRRLDDLVDRWPYLRQDAARTVACAIQLCDVNRFFLNTWSIGLTAGAMWEWHCTIPVIAVIESLLHEYGVQRNLIAPGTKLKKMIDTFQSKGVISHRLRERLHELREYRNEIHLQSKAKVSMYRGKPKRYNQAVLRLKALEKAILKYAGTKAPAC